MNRRRNNRWIAMAGLAAAAWLLAGCPERPPEGARMVGQALPPLVLEALQGDTMVPADWRGRTVVLNIWATWCGPCREEMPTLERLSHDLDPSRYLVVGLALDEDRNLVREFALEYGLSFPLVLDPGGRTVQGALGVWALPDTLIVTPAGRIADRVQGAADWSSPALRRRVAAAWDPATAAAQVTGASR